MRRRQRPGAAPGGPGRRPPAPWSRHTPIEPCQHPAGRVSHPAYRPKPVVHVFRNKESTAPRRLELMALDTAICRRSSHQRRTLRAESESAADPGSDRGSGCRPRPESHGRRGKPRLAGRKRSQPTGVLAGGRRASQARASARASSRITAAASIPSQDDHGRSRGWGRGDDGGRRERRVGRHYRRTQVMGSRMPAVRATAAATIPVRPLPPAQCTSTLPPAASRSSTSRTSRAMSAKAGSE